MRTLFLKCVMALAVVLSASAVSAAPILTFTFSGKVSTIISDDGSGTFGANFAVGDAVTGSWTFDAAATQNPILPYASAYDATFSVTISGKTFSGGAEYRIFDDAPGGGDDGFSVVNETGTFTGPSLGSLQPRSFFLQFLGMPTTTLLNQNIVTNPDVLMPLANPTYAPHGFRLDNPRDETFGGLYFTIDSVRRVPEPSTLWLMLLGVVVMVGYVRWRRTSPSVA